MKKHKFRNNGNKGLRALLIGVLLTFVIYTALVLLMSFAAYATSDPTGKIKLFSLIALMLSCVISGFINGNRYKNKATPVACSVIFSLVMLIVGIIHKGGAPTLGSIINCILCVAITAISAKITVSRQNGRKIKRR